MATKGTFFLAIWPALLLTVRALQCYTTIEYDCSPSGTICDLFPPTTLQTVTECDSDVTMCGLITFGATASNFKVQSSLASCLPKEDDFNFTNGCYGRKELEKIDPDEAEAVKQLEEIIGVTFEPVEICICDGNLCNGSIKSVFSISTIIASVLISFMLFN